MRERVWTRPAFFAKTLPVSADRYAGFDFGNGAIDYFNRSPAVAAFVVLGPLQCGFRFAQMRERSPHVGLIGPNGLKAQARNQNNENDSCA